MCGLTGATRGIILRASVAHMAFLRIARAAKRQHRGVARLESCLGRQILAGIGLDAAILFFVEQSCRLHHHQVRSLQLRPAFRQRVLDSLVLPDGTVEDDPFARIFAASAPAGVRQLIRCG